MGTFVRYRQKGENASENFQSVIFLAHALQNIPVSPWLEYNQTSPFLGNRKWTPDCHCSGIFKRLIGDRIRVKLGVCQVISYYNHKPWRLSPDLSSATTRRSRYNLLISSRWINNSCACNFSLTFLLLFMIPKWWSVFSHMCSIMCISQ